MKPGQAALTTGLWTGVMPNGVETIGFLGVEVPVHEKVSVDLLAGLQRHADGSLDARDALLSASWLAVTKPGIFFRVRPGISIPTGGLGTLRFTSISTSSVDPWIGTDLLLGSTWVGGVSTVLRVPVYAGWDKQRQGLFGRVDLRVARRFETWLPMIGVSTVGQGPSSPKGASPSFGEISATAATMFHPHDRWSVTLQGRLPVWTSGTWVPSFGLAVRTVVGKRPDHP